MLTITSQNPVDIEADAIVSTAMFRDGETDDSLETAAGPELAEVCRDMGGVPTGEAILTRGYKLPARHIIHTVGPVWRGGRHGEAELLRTCYRSALDIAKANGFKSIVFPCISEEEAYSYPREEAAQIAVNTVRAYLAESNFKIDIVFAVRYCQNKDLYRFLLNHPGPIKDTSVIPPGGYCHRIVPIKDGEIISEDTGRFGKDLREFRYHGNTKEILCPYWRRTDYGMVRCEFLDIGSLEEWQADAREKAIAHYGSEEEYLKDNTSGTLYDEVKECGINIFDEDEKQDE